VCVRVCVRVCVCGFYCTLHGGPETRMGPVSGGTAGRYVVIAIPLDLLAICCFLVHIPFRPEMQMRPLGGATVARGRKVLRRYVVSGIPPDILSLLSNSPSVSLFSRGRSVLGNCILLQRIRDGYGTVHGLFTPFITVSGLTERESLFFFLFFSGVVESPILLLAREFGRSWCLAR
jgi:hypothetical protein